MPYDTELDRLKTEQDRAFQRKQNAYQAMDDAWKRRSAARDVQNRAYAEQQRAYEIQDAAWQNLQRIRSYNGPRIDALNAQQDNAFQNMKNAFDRASNAHDMRDGASARSYADEGHRFKQESQECVAERRQLVQEIRDAKAQHEATRPAFLHAKKQFGQAKSEHSRTKAEHERKREEFNRAKADFDRAKAAFVARLEMVRANSKRRKDDNRSIAERAGVPYQYLDDVMVSRRPEGGYNIYFGGVGKPNGNGHGHRVLESDGSVSYAREPFDPHGSQNFADAKRPTVKSRWTPRSSEPPYVGVIDDTDHVVSFKTKGDDVIIADGDYSEDNKGFSRNPDNSKAHNHYGPWGAKDRGRYTGPDA